MRRRGLLYGVLAAAALVLAGCQGEPGEGPATGGGEVRFSGGIAGMTRAAGTQWDAGDTIGISAAEGTKYENKAYRTATGGATGAFLPVGEADKIYYETAGSEGFKAYYPYNGSVTADSPYITASTADQNRQKEFDFLYGEGSGSRNRPEVSLTFAHRMARLVLTIVPDGDTSLEEVKAATYTFSNLVEEGQFNAFTGEATATGEAVTDRTLAGTEIETGVICDLILFPQQFESVNKLTFAATVGAQTLEAKIDFSAVADNGGNRLQSGMQYNLTVRMKKTSLTIGDCTIEPWATGFLDIEASIKPPVGNKPVSQIEPGDFYFSDGTFADKGETLTDDQKADCIGIVLKKGRDTEGDWADDGIYTLKDGTTPMPEVRGYALALRDVIDGNMCQWGSDDKIDVNCDRNETTGFNGYSSTQTIVAFNKAKGWNLQEAFPAVYHATNYETECPAPDNTSGWFLPSGGQCQYWINNGDVIETSVLNAGGDGYKDYYWSSSEIDNTNPYSNSDSAYFLNGFRGMAAIGKEGPCSARAILAF